MKEKCNNQHGRVLFEFTNACQHFNFHGSKLKKKSKHKILKLKFTIIFELFSVKNKFFFFSKFTTY